MRSIWISRPATLAAREYPLASLRQEEDHVAMFLALWCSLGLVYAPFTPTKHVKKLFFLKKNGSKWPNSLGLTYTSFTLTEHVLEKKGS